MLNRKYIFTGAMIGLVAIALTSWIPGLFPAKNSFMAARGIEAEGLFGLDEEMEEERENSERYDKPDEAQEFYVQKRAPVGQKAIPVERYALARQQIDQMTRYESSTDTVLPSMESTNGRVTELFQSWKALGPGNVGGRTRTLVIHPTQPNIMYIAGVAGGIWKSTNSGKSWRPLDDMMANLAVTSLTMHPNNPQILYAATGEGVFNVDAVRGNGIFKTTNGGKTWKQLNNTANNSNFYYVNKIAVSANKPNRIYAVTRTGLWRSTDAGKTWKQLYAAKENGGCLDLAVRTDRGPDDHVLISCGNFSTAALYRSVRNGNNLKKVLSQAKMGRTSLAVAPSNQNVIYALASSVDNSSKYYLGLHAVFRSNDGGATWVKRTSNTSKPRLNTLLLSNTVYGTFQACGFGSDAFYNQGWYDNIIAVDPKNPNIVWTGGIDLFRSNDGGKNWGLASYWWASKTNRSYVHADQHGIVFHPKFNGTSNKVMFVTNDGGIFRTNNARAKTVTGPKAACSTPLNTNTVGWQNLNNNYAVTQFYHGAAYPSGTTYFGGTQDNGTIRGNDSAGPNKWKEIHGGDGGYVAVDPKRTQRLFLEYTYLSIKKSTDGGKSFNLATSGIAESSYNFLFINPFLMDPNNANVLWTGGNTLWRTKNQASSWVQASKSNMSSSSFSAFAVAKGASNFAVAGTRGGSIFSSKNALNTNSSTQWTEAQPVPGGFVSSLAYDPGNKQVVYATYSTFGVRHIWKSTDAGKSWRAIDKLGKANGIPDIPVHSIVVEPGRSKRLYAGTDLGIFVSNDGGNSWAVENTGFTNTVVEHLEINVKNGVKTLFAFTHGRGAWRTKLQ